MTASSIITGIALVLAVYVLLILAWRLRVRSVIDAMRHFAKWVNPAMMRLAGQRHWYASVLYHKGRRSGRQYATPLGIFPTDDSFVIALAYGEEVDWLKNVLAEGEATIKTKGETYTIVEPEVIDTSEVLPLLPAGARLLMRFIRVYGIYRCLKVRRA